MVFKFNHDPLGPEENARDAINCDIEGAVVAGGEWPPGCSFQLLLSAQVVADNLKDHTEDSIKRRVVQEMFSILQ